MTGMTKQRSTPITPAEARAAVCEMAAAGSQKAAAESLGITRPALQRRLRRAAEWGITEHGEMFASPSRQLEIKPGIIKRILFTSAQNNTKVNPALWENGLALAAHYDAEIMIGRIRYNHTASQVGQEKTQGDVDGGLWYDSAFEPYFADERIEICPGLIWAGDMNIIPTATNPLSGLDSFTGSDSCIFPHPQISLQSIATAPGTDPKFNYTTGAVTLKRYIKRKAGLKAEFHHAYAFLLVEVDCDGDWFVRQINADDAGTIQDLGVKVESGSVTTGNRIEVFTPGDIHGTELDPICRDALWGPGGMIDDLRPRHQILHDVLNFGARSHHNSFFDLLSAHYGQRESVEGEIVATAAALTEMLRPDVKTYVVKANHDEHLDRWVREADYRRDPVNAAFYLAAANALVLDIRDNAGGKPIDLAEWSLKRAGLADDVEFLSRRDRLEIAGIRHDQHGDMGPNGARGSAVNISKTGEKTNIGHSHSARIVHGCYQGGTMSLLDMGYNTGPSSWSHSLILTTPSGKRQIITLKNGKWKA